MIPFLDTLSVYATHGAALLGWFAFWLTRNGRHPRLAYVHRLALALALLPTLLEIPDLLWRLDVLAGDEYSLVRRLIGRPLLLLQQVAFLAWLLCQSPQRPAA